MTSSNALTDPRLAGLPPLREPGFWDGVAHSYIPSGDLSVDPSLSLHRTGADAIDPVTFEVIRYSLLNLNLEHSALLEKLAVSQVIILGRDYQTAIMTQDGESLFVGPGVQYFANSASLSVQYTLENRSKNPGIDLGDMFLSNDVFVGAPHQPDACLAAPVFIGDELFCWVSNTLHYQDVGGSAPGSFCWDARDAWDEGQNWPPIKLVEAGELRTDVEQLFVRQSRFPMEVGMDLRAAIAANEYTRRKVVELVDRYGADVVKGVMYGTLDAGEQLFVERLASIPDGIWSHRVYTEASVPGDRSLYTYQVNVRKIGDRLIVDNRGTDPQAGAINISFAAFAGGALAAIMGQIVPDLAGAFGGPYRRVEFRPEPGLLNCADFPAAVSPSGAITTEMHINTMCIAIAKMLSCGDDETRDLMLGPTFTASSTLPFAGVDQQGEPYLALAAEVMLASFAGTASRDGDDFGGHWWIPNGIGPNVEDLEAKVPALYLYRYALPLDLGGAGRHRGGVGLVGGVTTRNTQGGVLLWTLAEAFPTGQGVLGAPPAAKSDVTIVSGSDVYDRLAAGRIPHSANDVAGKIDKPLWKTINVPIQDGDLFEYRFPGMAGYGDPLRRTPEHVCADFAAHMLDEATALRVYGVVIEDGAVDADATLARRREMRKARLGREPGEAIDPPAGARRVGELLHVVDGRWWCNGADLGPVTDNYKEQAVLRESRTQDIGPEFETTDAEMVAHAVYREFICPVTGYRIDAEIDLVGHAPLHDIRLWPS